MTENELHNLLTAKATISPDLQVKRATSPKTVIGFSWAAADGFYVVTNGVAKCLSEPVDIALCDWDIEARMKSEVYAGLMQRNADAAHRLAAKDSEIAALKAQMVHVASGNEEFRRRMNLALLAQQEAEADRDGWQKSSTEFAQQLHDARFELAAAQSEIAALKSQQNTPKPLEKRGFPTFNSSEWKP